MVTMPLTASEAPTAGRGWVRAVVALLAAAALGGSAAGAQAQASEPPARATANFVPGGPAASGPDLVSQLAALREQRLRTALERVQPAPRVQAVVQALLPPDVQVVVVRQAPGGLGSYDAGLTLVGYDHVYSNVRQRGVHGGRRGLIVLDARLEEHAEREAIAFVLAHEYAHHRLGHGHTEEDADAYARRMLLALGLWSPAGAAGAFELAAGASPQRTLGPVATLRLRALEQADAGTAVAGRQP